MEPESTLFSQVSNFFHYLMIVIMKISSLYLFRHPSLKDADYTDLKEGKHFQYRQGESSAIRNSGCA